MEAETNSGLGLIQGGIGGKGAAALIARKASSSSNLRARRADQAQLFQSAVPVNDKLERESSLQAVA